MIILQDVVMPENRNSKPMTATEEREIVARAKAGDAKAIRILLDRNSRYVLKMAKRYMGMGVELKDLYQEGRIGLYIAIGHYDPSAGFRFMTYALNWAKQKMWRAVMSQGPLLRLPASYYTLPRGEDTKEEREGKREKMDLVYRHMHPTRLDHPRRPEDGPLDLRDPDDLVDTEIDERRGRKTLGDLLESLPAVERKIMKDRLGWDNEGPKTFRAIAQDLGISKERTRQLQVQAERRLRKSVGEVPWMIWKRFAQHSKSSAGKCGRDGMWDTREN